MRITKCVELLQGMLDAQLEPTTHSSSMIDTAKFNQSKQSVVDACNGLSNLVPKFTLAYNGCTIPDNCTFFGEEMEKYLMWVIKSSTQYFEDGQLIEGLRQNNCTTINSLLSSVHNLCVKMIESIHSEDDIAKAAGVVWTTAEMLRDKTVSNSEYIIGKLETYISLVQDAQQELTDYFAKSESEDVFDDVNDTTYSFDTEFDDFSDDKYGPEDEEQARIILNYTKWAIYTLKSTEVVLKQMNFDGVTYEWFNTIYNNIKLISYNVDSMAVSAYPPLDIEDVITPYENLRDRLQNTVNMLLQVEKEPSKQEKVDQKLNWLLDKIMNETLL
eukprot:TRINITY_DN11127_c0_g1_i1.p1 TRINITY_DN11127_c0_g1~~TRINITY_DN11127_c0_g1_i1.p1  ORF type:complete len:345 (-),score=83.30 TRINITY_DN11127_c0_g1_i1:89-1075(-)